MIQISNNMELQWLPEFVVTLFQTTKFGMGFYFFAKEGLCDHIGQTKIALILRIQALSLSVFTEINNWLIE